VRSLVENRAEGVDIRCRPISLTLPSAVGRTCKLGEPRIESVRVSPESEPEPASPDRSPRPWAPFSFVIRMLLA